MKGYKKLITWQKSVKLIGSVYSLTEALPKSETYGIVQQMRRAVSSISSNIAEGYYKSTVEYLRFCKIAYGSAAELESQAISLKEMGFIAESDIQKVEQQVVEVLKLLNGLTSSIKRKIEEEKTLTP